MNKTKLMLGDNIESLKKLPDNSIDSVVTDPPYALTSIKKRFGKEGSAPAQFGTDGAFQRASKGFMGKEWDAEVPKVEFWKEVYRVLKPGGHVLSFGGTRTYHRMVVNIEDAGFEIRDQVMWLYGCLDNKSEILTDSGWKKYTEITLNDKALSWNSELDILEFNKIDDIIIKPYKGDMILLKNKHTEQILTPNHRVYHKYERKDRGYFGENWEVINAGDMKKSGSYTLPLASYYEGKGIGGEDYAALLGWIWSEGEFDKKGNSIRISQSSVNQPLVDEIKDLIERLNIKYSHYSRERFYNYKHKGLQSYIDNSFYFSTENDINDKIRTDLTNKKLNFDFVKKMTIREKIAFLDAAHKGDGSKGRETIYQNDLSQLELLQFMLLTIGKSSYFDLNKMAINFRNKETTQLQHNKLNKKVYYEGDVWCVRVKNSAFVARRGDKVFITGNSGFPKSHNIGKAVDKIEGNEREVVGIKENKIDLNATKEGDTSFYENAWQDKNYIDIEVTKGQSKYEGWGTALKPANEPICVARKPLSEKTIAENVIKWGTGGINIDGCRIGNEVRTTPVGSDDSRDDETLFGLNKTTHHERVETTEGRFPANIILECCCDKTIDGGTIKSGSSNRTDKGVVAGVNGFGRGTEIQRETQVEIHTNPDCPCRLLDEQTGYLKSGEVKPHHKKNKTANGYQGSCYGKFQNEDTTLKGYGDGGGASRFFYQAKVSKAERNMGLDEFEEKESVLPGLNTFDEEGNRLRNDGSIIPPLVSKNSHPTVKPINLMTYLCRLVTPPNGIVLDPFMGSGSTGIAAQLEGFRFVGMEQDKSYFDIASARIEAYEDYRKLLK